MGGSDLDPLARQLAHLARQAIHTGDLASAEQLYAGVFARDPANIDAGIFLVSRALQAKDWQNARSLAERALSSMPSPELHFLHGRALEALNDRDRARDAYAEAHARNPRMFIALFCQAAQEEALGKTGACLGTYHRALVAAEAAGALQNASLQDPSVRQHFTHAATVLREARATVIEEALMPIRSRHSAAAIERIQRAANIYLDHRRSGWPHPLQRPTFMLVPDLEPKPWFERDAFPFLAQLEQHTLAIREELSGVLADESLLSPYVDMPAEAQSAPVWNELNRSMRWSSFHLYRHGARVEAHCLRCPRTVAALESIQLMKVPEHSPEALFSLLKAGTHIPLHTGVTNGRLTVHLPLIVPPNCGALKVGNEQRIWVEGQCLIFDDSFAHEAWNTSNQDRVVLIFDIWDPRLSEAEREAMAALIATIGRFDRLHFGNDTTREAH